MDLLPQLIVVIISNVYLYENITLLNIYAFNWCILCGFLTED